MEYEKRLISLYGESPLPKMFVTLSKRARELLIEVNSAFPFDGVLFVCLEKNVMYKNVKTNDNKFFLNSVFSFDGEYIFCFISKKEKYVGVLGNPKNKECAINYFSKIYLELQQKQNKKDECIFDEEYITNGLINKIFGNRLLLFFEQTQKQLYYLFANCERAGEIEKVIPSSKFVCLGERGNRDYVGVVYKGNKPFAVAIGFDYFSSNKLINEGVYQCFICDKKTDSQSTKQASFFLSFRSAADGSVIWLK